MIVIGTISSMMPDHGFQESSQPYFGRKLLQTNSSSFDSSQPSFIALITVIVVLTIAFVITMSILCYRYYSHRERKFKHRQKHRRVLSVRNNQPTTVQVSVTPTSASSYSGRSSEELLSDRRQQNVSINTLPSRRLQQSMIDAYLNDLNSLQPATIDVNQLSSYLFIDLHSTSSETFPDTFPRQFPNHTKTSGYNTSTGDDSQRNHPYYLKHQQRRRSILALKRSHDPRFLMRERSLPDNLHTLPQLRPITTRQQRRLFGLDDTSNSTTTMTNQDLQSTTMSTTTTDDYDDSHAYNVKQNQMLQTIKEERPFVIQGHLSSMSFHDEGEQNFFEIVSTSRDDSSDIRIPYMSSPIIGHRITYMNDSIIV